MVETYPGEAVTFGFGVNPVWAIVIPVERLASEGRMAARNNSIIPIERIILTCPEAGRNEWPFEAENVGIHLKNTS